MPKVKGVSTAALNKRQQTAMSRHASHHTAKPLRVMVGAMKKGQTFTQSHKTAMKKVGRQNAGKERFKIKKGWRIWI